MTFVFVCVLSALGTPTEGSFGLYISASRPCSARDHVRLSWLEILFSDPLDLAAVVKVIVIGPLPTTTTCLLLLGPRGARAFGGQYRKVC